MLTAFGRAMLDTIHGQPQCFRMSMSNGSSVKMNCGEFLHCRNEEQGVLDNLNLPEDGKILDYGCGAGRHLIYLRQKHISVQCVGIEVCDLLRNHCTQAIPEPSAFYDSWDKIPANDRVFDLILLLGNGLGVLGTECETVKKLKTLVDSLRPHGQIIIESGNPFGHGYYSADFTIAYKDFQDAPFTWGYADRTWLSATLKGFGCTVEFSPSNAPGGMFFLGVVQKKEKPASFRLNY
jgi:SAM-dependent methyltransferase